MRFVLDEDVPAQVVSVFSAAGHDAWTVPSAGLSAVSDEVVAVYGHEKNAAVVTHDKEFSKWRRKNCVGKHVFLRCEEPDAADLLHSNLDSIVAVFERHQDIYCEVAIGGLEFVFSGWS